MPVGGGFTCGCGGGSDCPSPTTPIATTGLCLPDGTPLAVVIERDCSGTTAQAGWLNLSTGAYTTGVPPTGATACGEARSIQVSGVFCDLADDGTVYGLVLTEYHYADDGSIDSVRLVSAATGETYALQGTLSICPGAEGETGQRYEVAPVPLCVIDTEGSGGVLQNILAEVVYDTATGERTGVRYVDQATGAPVALPGGTTIAVCPDTGPEPCASSVTTLRLCDLNPDVQPDADGKRCATPFLRHLVFDCAGALVDQHDTGLDGAAYTPVEVVDCGTGGVPALVEVPWNIVGIAPDPADAARGLIYTLSPDDDPTITATVAVHVTSNINSTCPGTPPNYAVSNPCTYTFTPDATLQDVATYVRVDLLDFDNFEPVSGLTPRPDRLGGTAYWDGNTVRPTENDGAGSMYYDGPPAQMSYRVGNTGGGTSCSALSFAAVSLKPQGCCGCTGDGGGADTGRTVQELCVISTAAPDVVQTWTRVIEADGTTVFYLDPTGQRFDTTLPAGFIIVACAPPTGATVQALTLCDTAADGEVTAFLRHVVADDTGATTTVTDTTLDGTTPYTTVGTVGVCGAAGDEEESPGELGCAHCETLTLCDVQPGEEESPGEGTEVPWTTVSVVEDPATAGAHTDFIFTISPQDDPSVVGTVHVNVSQAAGGPCGTFDINNLVFSNTAQYHLELDEVAQQVSFLRVDLLDFDGFEPVAILTGTPEPSRLGGTAVWDAGHARIIPTEDNGTGELYWDSPPPSIAYEIFNTGGGTSCSQLSFAGVTIVPPPPPPPAGTATPFLRTTCRACDGTVLSVTDSTVDGAPFTPTGQVTVCGEAAASGRAAADVVDCEDGARALLVKVCAPEESPGEPEPCHDSTVVLLCDVPADSTVTVTPAIEDATAADIGQTQFADLPGSYTALWSGGRLAYPAGAGPGQQHSVATGRITATAPDGCDTAGGTLTVTVRVTQNGPGTGQDWDGALRLFRGTTLLAAKDVLHYAPPGYVQALTASVPVTADDLTSGELYAALMLETFHLSAKAWTADQFSATVELDGCESTAAVQILRTVVTDCETGAVVSTTDTTLDGQPYTVTGTVGQCAPAGGTADAECCDTGETLPLCDVADDGTSTPFLRRLTYTPGVATPSIADFALDGTTPYTPLGTVGTCTEPCRDTSSTLLCDTAATETLTVFDPANRPDDDGWQVVSFTGANSGSGPEAAMPYPARYGTRWNGVPALAARTDQTAGVPATATSGFTYNTASVRWVLRKTFEAPEDGVAVAQSVAFRGDGGARVRINGKDAGMYGQWNQPATSGTTQIPVTAGPNTVEIEVRDVGGPNYVTGRLDIALPHTTQFMRRQTVDCETGQIIATTDTTLDGQPYTVVGEVGQCTPTAVCCEQPPPEQRVDVESELMCILTADGEIGGQVLVERVYDDQTGDRTTQRLTDPTTGDEVTLSDGAKLVQCQTPTCPTAFSTECVGAVTRTEAGYDNTSLIGGVPGQCGSVQGPDGEFPCQPASGGYTIVSWVVNGEEVIGEDGGRAFAGGPCGEGDPGNLGMHHNWGLALTNLDPSGATWAAQSAPGCAWFVGSTGGTQTVYGPMIVADDAGQRWTLGPAQQCEETQYTKVYSQECDGTVSVSWLDAQGVPTDAPTGDLVPCGTGCGKSGGAGLDVEVIQLCDLSDDESGTATSTPFLRHLVYDTGGAVTFVADTGLDGLTPYTPAGEVGTCGAEAAPCPAQSVLQECRYDDTDGDGAADTAYVELIGVGCDGTLTPLGTYTEGLAGPYTPVAPVDPPEEGPDPVTLVEPHRIELDPGQTWDASSVTLLQSVTATAHGGTGQITTADGTSTLFDSESVSWSIIRDDDTSLTGPLTITAGPGTVTVSYTRTTAS
jgi:hypothetical protein